MADNKNQHFVPRCYLRPFSLDRAGKVINLFNLDLARAIPRAPVKGQCSGDYFYGDDLRLERLLQTFEGDYANLLKRLSGPDYRLNAEDQLALKRFWLLQHLRTEAASLRLVQMNEQMERDLGTMPPGFRMNIKEAVQTAMTVFFEEPRLVDDLKVCLVRNGTQTPFLTSDNPAVMTNRWHLTDRRARGVSPGLRNSGTLGFLPLTPDALCILYDPALHLIPHTHGWTTADQEADVSTFNEHQVLNCNANLYFDDWAQRGQVDAFVAGHADRRLPARYRLNHLVLDREQPGERIYRRVSAEEARQHQGSIVHSEALTSTPSRWPSTLRWRAGGFVYDTGTGEGYVRGAHRENGRAYRKVRVRD